MKDIARGYPKGEAAMFLDIKNGVEPTAIIGRRHSRFSRAILYWLFFSFGLPLIALLTETLFYFVHFCVKSAGLDWQNSKFPLLPSHGLRTPGSFRPPLPWLSAYGTRGARHGAYTRENAEKTP